MIPGILPCRGLLNQVIAVDYESLIAALVARKHELGLSNLDVDEAGGLQSGYFSKLTSDPQSPAFRRMGLVSLGGVLNALDVAIVVTPRKHILSPAKDAIEANKHKKNRVLSKRGSRGGRMTWTMMSDSKRRKKIAKMCAAAQKARLNRLAPAAAGSRPSK
jgi:hypothetical protein